MLACFSFLSISVGAHAQRELVGTGAPTSAPNITQGIELRREAINEAVSTEGLIRLDATVTDQTGKAVSRIQRQDFEVIDNDRQNQIVAFRAPDIQSAENNSPKVILLIDTLGLSRDLAAFAPKRRAIKQSRHDLLAH